MAGETSACRGIRSDARRDRKTQTGAGVEREMKDTIWPKSWFLRNGKDAGGGEWRENVRVSPQIKMRNANEELTRSAGFSVIQSFPTTSGNVTIVLRAPIFREIR